jgi:hypothetical protein
MPVASYRHAKMLQDAVRAGITVEDLARASASYDVEGDLLQPSMKNVPEVRRRPALS